MAFMAKNRSLSHCKVVEVISETTPLTPMEELLAKIPSQRAGGASLKVLKKIHPNRLTVLRCQFMHAHTLTQVHVFISQFASIKNLGSSCIRN